MTVDDVITVEETQVPRSTPELPERVISADDRQEVMMFVLVVSGSVVIESENEVETDVEVTV